MGYRGEVDIYGFLFLLSFGLIFLFAPMSIALARSLGAIDYPDSRKVHQAPVPRLGGMALAAAVWVSLLAGCLFNPYLKKELFALRGILVGSLVILLLGLYDDIFNARPLPKLLAQTVAAGLAVSMGTTFALASNPLAQGMRDYFDLGIFAIPVSIFWIVGLTNAINLIDGLDGLATGIAMFASISLFLISVNQGAGVVTYFYAVISGGCLAFLRFNRFPARVFLGDCGSTFLGFTLACLSIHGSQKSYTLTALFIPLVVFGLPIFESISTLLRRHFSNRRIQEADSEHLHHRLLHFGLTQRQVVWILYSLTIILGIIGFTFTVLLDEYAAVIVIIVGMLGGFLGKELKVFARERRVMERQVRYLERSGGEEQTP